MGIQQSKISNRTGALLHILVFDDMNTGFYQDIRQPPDDGRAIELDGSDNGAPVRVGVIHNEVAGRYVFDLFRLSNGATLIIKEVTREGGVQDYERVKGVELVSLGRTINKSADCANWFLKARTPSSSHSGELSSVSHVTTARQDSNQK